MAASGDTTGRLCWYLENDISAKLAIALAKEGISAFRFDFSGNGESEGSFDYTNYYGEADDLRSVVEYFRGENLETRAVTGHSKGGVVVLLYASGRYDLKEGIEEHLGNDFMEKIKKDGFFNVKNKEGEFMFCITEDSLMVRLNINMLEACLQIDKSCRSKHFIKHVLLNSRKRVFRPMDLSKKGFNCPWDC